MMCVFIFPTSSFVKLYGLLQFFHIFHLFSFYLHFYVSFSLSLAVLCSEIIFNLCKEKTIHTYNEVAMRAKLVALEIKLSLNMEIKGIKVMENVLLFVFYIFFVYLKVRNMGFYSITEL